MKRLISIILIMVLLITMIGCESVQYRKDAMGEEEHREMFTVIDTGIVYDNQTEIVYYFHDNYTSFSITPFYSEDKQLMTKDEYISMYGD